MPRPAKPRSIRELRLGLRYTLRRLDTETSPVERALLLQLAQAFEGELERRGEGRQSCPPHAHD